MDSEPKTGTIILSQESQDIITSTLAREKKSIRTLQKDIEDIRGKRKSTGIIFNFLIQLEQNRSISLQNPKYRPIMLSKECGSVSTWKTGMKTTSFFSHPQMSFLYFICRIHRRPTLGKCYLYLIFVCN
jgi:hypothetical protein